MQMLVIAAVLPSLLLLSGTSAYSSFRVGGALLAGAASAGWIYERLFDVDMRVDVVVDAFAHHAVWAAGILFLLSLACKSLSRVRRTHLLSTA
jgi:hypothetical protein